jgi:hypothetical protein
MAGVRYTVLHPEAPRLVADPNVGEITHQLRDEVASRTPVETGTLQAGWQVKHGEAVGVYLLFNDVDYARYVEYGTSKMAAEPMLGPVLAEARGSWGQ